MNLSSTVILLLGLLVVANSLPTTVSSECECCKAPTSPEDRRSDTSKLKVAQYNVEFLMTDDSDTTIKCPGDDCPWKNETAALQHVDDIAKELTALDADVISLNEVGSCEVLDQVLKAMPSSVASTYRAYLVKSTDYFTGQSCAMITRVDPIQDLERTDLRVKYPVSESTCPREVANATNATQAGSDDSYGCSKHYHTKLQLKGVADPITFVGFHLLAHPDDESRCPQREAQAEVLAEAFIRPANKNHEHLIVLGDMNDFDDKLADSAGNKPMSAVSRIFRDSGDLSNAAGLVSNVDERYTSWWDRNDDCVDEAGTEHSMIDHVFLSQSLYDAAETSISHDYQQSCSNSFSDHWPVIVSIDTSKLQ